VSVLELGVRVTIWIIVKHALGTKRPGTKRLGYEMSGSQSICIENVVEPRVHESSVGGVLSHVG